MTRPRCPARKLLLRNCRPTTHSSQIAAGLCPTECIFCDIWQLASLVQEHTPLTRSPPSSPISSRASSPSSSSDISQTLKSLSQQFQTQRARLASILSICVVEGADESEGLRLAHDRCLSAVTSLISQRAILEQMEEFSFEQREEVVPAVQTGEGQRSLRRESGSCRLRDSYFGGRRNSQMGMAM